MGVRYTQVVAQSIVVTSNEHWGYKQLPVANCLSVICRVKLYEVLVIDVQSTGRLK